MFRAALGNAIGMRCVERVRHPGVVLVDGLHLRWLGTIDTTGTGEQKTGNSVSHGIIQQVPGTIDYLDIALQWTQARTIGGIGGRMQHMGKIPPLR
ncbi:hypothetical protein D3C75_984900 [compost metagenome]